MIFAPSSMETGAALETTKTVPIVFGAHADPVGVGHVASLARPGGNATGMTMLLTDLVAKELEAFKEALPDARRFGVLFASTAPSVRNGTEHLAQDGVDGFMVFATPRSCSQ